MNLFKVVEDEVIFKCISRQFAFLLNGLLMGTQKRAKAEMLSEIFFFSTQECIFSRKKGRKTRLEMERISYRRSARRPFQQRWLTKPYGAPNEQASSDESGHQGQKTIFHHFSLNRVFLPKKAPIFDREIALSARGPTSSSYCCCCVVVLLLFSSVVHSMFNCYPTSGGL